MNYEDKNFRVRVREAQLAADSIIGSSFVSGETVEAVNLLRDALVKLEEDAKLQIGLKAQIAVEKRNFAAFKNKQRYLKTKTKKFIELSVAEMAMSLKTTIRASASIKKCIDSGNIHLVCGKTQKIENASQEIADELKNLKQFVVEKEVRVRKKKKKIIV